MRTMRRRPRPWHYTGRVAVGSGTKEPSYLPSGSDKSVVSNASLAHLLDTGLRTHRRRRRHRQGLELTFFYFSRRLRRARRRSQNYWHAPARLHVLVIGLGIGCNDCQTTRDALRLVHKPTACTCFSSGPTPSRVTNAPS